MRKVAANAASRITPPVLSNGRFARSGLVEIIPFSPFDLLVFVRIMLISAAWKYLSIDYRALADLGNGPDMWYLPFAWAARLIDHLQPILLDEPWKVITLQVGASVLLFLTAWRPKRWLLAPALVTIVYIEWTASQYRASLYDIDMQLALLAILLFWPQSWNKLLSSETNVTAPATTLGACMCFYIGMAYLMCGVSKIQSDPFWWMDVRLDLLVHAQVIWAGAVMPDWLDPTAQLIHRVFSAFPWLDKTSCFMTLVIEAGWWLAVFSRPCRRFLPLAMFATHAAIFLGSGLLFLGMMITGLSSCIAWRRLVTPIVVSRGGESRVMTRIRKFDWFDRIRFEVDDASRAEGETIAAHDVGGEYHGVDAALHAMLRCPLLAPMGGLGLVPGVQQLLRVVSGLLGAGSSDEPVAQRPRVPRFILVGLLITGATVVYPAKRLQQFPPFLNYRFFGWSYKSLAEPVTVYQLGYRDGNTGEIKFFPLNHAGFLDFQIIGGPRWPIQTLIDETRTEAERENARQVLDQYVRAIRTHHSSRWLLGPLTLPQHCSGKTDPVPRAWLDRIYLLEGRYELLGDELTVKWTVLGESVGPTTSLRGAVWRGEWRLISDNETPHQRHREPATEIRPPASSLGVRRRPPSIRESSGWVSAQYPRNAAAPTRR